ncbi:MAG: four helix bundle protein [Bacteroidia bacterium]|nr:four helix bundle protein [Bacteroidia bacterium]
MDYKKLDVWRFSKALASKMYIKTREFPKEDRFGLTSQIRRCAVSIPANIAEGCGRRSNKDTLRFLYISRGSIYELETHLIISLDLDLIGQDVFEELNSDLEECKKLLHGFINYFKKRLNSGYSND